MSYPSYHEDWHPDDYRHRYLEDEANEAIIQWGMDQGYIPEPQKDDPKEWLIGLAIVFGVFVGVPFLLYLVFGVWDL